MIKRIFLDMDGVICNWMAHLLSKYNRHPDELQGVTEAHEFLGIEKDDLNLHCEDPTFWHQIPKMPDADVVISLCADRVGMENIALLSSPGNWLRSAEGKRLWIQEHYPMFRKRLILTQSKHLCVATDSLLVEDYVKNVKEYREAGGPAILIPRPWNAEWRDSNRAMEIFKQRLEGVFRNPTNDLSAVATKA